MYFFAQRDAGEGKRRILGDQGVTVGDHVMGIAIMENKGMGRELFYLC
jgi:hypothetical protein